MPTRLIPLREDEGNQEADVVQTDSIEMVEVMEANPLRKIEKRLAKYGCSLKAPFAIAASF